MGQLRSDVGVREKRSVGNEYSPWINAGDEKPLWVIPHGRERFGMGGGLV